MKKLIGHNLQLHIKSRINIACLLLRKKKPQPYNIKADSNFMQHWNTWLRVTSSEPLSEVTYYLRFEQVHEPSSEKGQIWKLPNNSYINVMQWKLSVPNKSHVICMEVLRFMVWGGSESCLNYRNLSPVILGNHV